MSPSRAAGASRPTLVVLDGHTLNPGDLDWAPLHELADTVIHARTPAEEIVSRAEGRELVLTNKTPLDADTLRRLPRLRYIGVLATGWNVVDAAAAARRGIPVTNVPGYGTESVAQHTLALLLELASRVGLHHRSVDRGEWAAQPDFCYWKAPLVELSGLTFGIIGLGTIGRRVARLADALGMRVIAARSLQGATAPAGDIPRLPLEELLACSDVVSLHCPLSPETERLIDARRLALMKPGAFLINTARGALIDEAALHHALAAGHLGGAALDVLSQEPPPPDHPLTRLPGCLITPHIAWASRAARARLLHQAVENLRGFLRGSPVNVINGAAR